MHHEPKPFLMDGTTPRCCDSVKRGGYSMAPQCTNAAKVTRTAEELRAAGIGGSIAGTYCKTHDPIARKQKQTARNAEWDAKWAARSEGWKKQEAINRLFPLLVAALKKTVTPENDALLREADKYV